MYNKWLFSTVTICVETVRAGVCVTGDPWRDRVLQIHLRTQLYPSNQAFEVDSFHSIWVIHLIKLVKISGKQKGTVKFNSSHDSSLSHMLTNSWDYQGQRQRKPRAFPSTWRHSTQKQNRDTSCFIPGMALVAWFLAVLKEAHISALVTHPTSPQAAFPTEEVSTLLFGRSMHCLCAQRRLCWWQEVSTVQTVICLFHKFAP